MSIDSTIIGAVVRANSKKRLEPVGDCVVFRFVSPGRSDAGLHLDTVEEKKKAIVIAIGPHCRRVKVGDQIVPWREAAKNIGTVDVTGEALGMVHECDIAAIVVDDGPAIEVA